jgi:hypothetical protein
VRLVRKVGMARVTVSPSWLGQAPTHSRQPMQDVSVTRVRVFTGMAMGWGYQPLQGAGVFRDRVAVELGSMIPLTRRAPMRALSFCSPGQLIARCESDCSGPDRGVGKKGKDMMKTSTKLTVAGAATLLGASLFAGGAYAATGLSAGNAPGRVLQVSGVAPAAAHASTVAVAHANTNAKGVLGTTAAPAARATAHPAARAASHVTTHVTMHATVRQVARPAAQQVPAHHPGTPTCGSDHGDTGMHGE